MDPFQQALHAQVQARHDIVASYPTLLDDLNTARKQLCNHRARLSTQRKHSPSLDLEVESRLTNAQILAYRFFLRLVMDWSAMKSMELHSEMRWKRDFGPHLRLLHPPHRTLMQEVISLQRESEIPSYALFYRA
jgi:hypothetical protein